MPTKKKRTYTFRNGNMIPYQSGSIWHKVAKMDVTRVATKRKKKLL